MVLHKLKRKPHFLFTTVSHLVAAVLTENKKQKICRKEVNAND